jgi:hypothetical protein
MRRTPVVALLAAMPGLLWLAAPAAAHAPPGCRIPATSLPDGDTARVYAIPHGCVRLEVSADHTVLPTVVVRRHDARGRVVVGRFPLPARNLDRANGSVGICARDSSFLFLVAYPYVTVVAQEEYDLGDGRRECATDVDRSLFWVGQLSRPPTLRMAAWYTNRPGR